LFETLGSPRFGPVGACGIAAQLQVGQVFTLDLRSQGAHASLTFVEKGLAMRLKGCDQRESEGSGDQHGCL
jgi:hypothetical protein